MSKRLQTLKTTVSRFSPILCCIFVFQLTLATAWSQDDEEEEQEKDIFELSPFVVSAADKSAYRAQSTLAGTRLKSDLKDVSASLSVIPQVFMEDIGATDAQDVLLYSVNTESEDEYIADDTEGLLAADTTVTRVRGLTSAANSRNFFSTNVLADTYNTERLTISRGANSILFGIGSASGTLDASYKMAMLNADSYAFNTRFDNNDSRRFVLDINKHIGENFAVRLAALDQVKETFMDPEFDDERRYYATFTYRPFSKTVIRAYYESMENYRVRGRRIMPADGLTEWMALGQPLYNNKTGQWVDRETEIPLEVQPDFIETQNFSRYVFSNNADFPRSERFPYGADAQYWEMTSISPDASGRSFLDESIIPFDRNVYGEGNWADIKADVYTVTLEQQLTPNFNLELAYNYEDWVNISREALRPGMDSAVQADVNMFLEEKVRGRLRASDVRNPNLGRIFIESNMIGFDRYRENETARATLSYQMDLTERAGWMGKHIFSALWQQEELDDKHVKIRAKNVVGSDVSLLTWGQYEGDPVDLMNRAYIDIGGMLGDGTGITAAGPWSLPKDNGYTQEEWPISYGANHENPIKKRDKIISRMIVWQGRFGMLDDEDDELILTYGFRQDRLRSYRAANTKERDENGLYYWDLIQVPGTPNFSEVGETGSLGVVYHTPFKGISVLYNRSDNFTPQSGFYNYFFEPHAAKTGETNDYGISFEALESTFYAKLVYFETEALGEIEHDWFAWAPNWFAIYAMEDQIRAWANKKRDPDDPHDPEGIWYQRMARDPNYVPNSYNADPKDDLPPAAEIYHGWHWQVGDMRPVRDRRTSGWELELFYQPTKNWNIRITASETESVDSNIAPVMQEFILMRKPVWDHYNRLIQPTIVNSALGSTSPEAMEEPGYVADPVAEAIAAGTYDDATLYAQEIEGQTFDSIYENRYAVAFGPLSNNRPIYLDQEAMPRVEEMRALEGLPTTRSRKYRVNLSTNYDFEEGPLANLGIGGGMRYRSKTSIGSLGKISTEDNSLFVPPDYLIADVTKPVYGDDILEFDFWVSYWNTFKAGKHEFRWNVSINVYNAFSEGGLAPAEVGFDGMPKRMLIEAPRVFSISAGIQY
jgi:hypothetical protein